VLFGLFQLQKLFLQLFPRLLGDLALLVGHWRLDAGSSHCLLFYLLVRFYCLCDEGVLALFVSFHLLHLARELCLHLLAAQQFLVGLLDAVVEAHFLFGEVAGVQRLAGLVQPVGLFADRLLFGFCVERGVRLAASWSSSYLARAMWFTWALSFRDSLSRERCYNLLRRLSTST
jgi:hypothetical protein